MKKIKKEKGITLVALIITIVVLLILAMVAIGTLEKSNIIGHAENAAERYEIEKANENEAILEMENWLDKYGQGVGYGSSPVGPMSTDPKAYLITVGSEQAVILWAEGKLYTMGNQAKQSETWDIVQITKEEAINQKGLKPKGFNEAELNEMYFFYEDEAVWAFSNDINTIYFPFMDEATNAMAISKDFYCGTHRDDLLAQYYHNTIDCEYYYTYVAPYSEGGTTVESAYEQIVRVDYANSKVTMWMGNLQGTTMKIGEWTITNKETNPNEFEITLDGGKKRITQNAIRLEVEGDQYMYIQDGIFYGVLEEGASKKSRDIFTFTKILNTTILQ